MSTSRDAFHGLYELAVFRHTRVQAKRHLELKQSQLEAKRQRVPEDKDAVAPADNEEADDAGDVEALLRLSPASGFEDDDDPPVANGHKEEEDGEVEEGEHVVADVVEGAGNGSGIVSLRIESDTMLFEFTESAAAAAVNELDTARILSQRTFDLLLFNAAACIVSINAAAAFLPKEWPALVAIVSAACFRANVGRNHPKSYVSITDNSSDDALLSAVEAAGQCYQRIQEVMLYFTQQRPAGGWEELFNGVKEKFNKNQSLKLILYGTLRVVTSKAMRPPPPAPPPARKR